MQEANGSRTLKRLRGALAVIEHHGLDKLIADEAEKLKRQIALLEELEEELEINQALLQTKRNA